MSSRAVTLKLASFRSVRVHGGGLPGAVDRGSVQVPGGLGLDAAAEALGVVGGEGDQTSAGVVLILDHDVAVGVGLVHLPIVVVLDRADVRPASSLSVWLIRPRLSMVRYARPAALYSISCNWKLMLRAMRPVSVS